jgi:lysozyme
MLKGIDVFIGDGAIEWHKVADDQNAFAFVRGAYGNVLDKSAAPNAAGARAVGMKVGLYHFFRARLDPQDQLDAFALALEQAKVGSGDLPPVLDIEDNPAYDGPWNSVDNQAYLASAANWVAKVKALVGKAPIIYTRASFWSELGNPPGYSGCPLWVASYRNDAPKLPADWPDYAFWQYSDAGTVPGISGHVDVNYFKGDSTPLQTMLL